MFGGGFSPQQLGKGIYARLIAREESFHFKDEAAERTWIGITASFWTSNYTKLRDSFAVPLFQSFIASAMND